jgi:hypothetical protein
LSRPASLPRRSLKLNEWSQRNRGDLMKTSNLKIVEQQTKAEQRDKEEESWRLTRAEITARVRAIRAQLEAFRAQLEGVPFDVVTNDMPVSLDYGNRPCLQNSQKRWTPPL